MNIIECKDGKVTAPGLYRMRPDQYHADCCPAPSLSSSLLNMMLNGSPAHAYHAHPKLGNGDRDDSSKAAEIGQAVHKLALGLGADITAIDAADYRGKEARAAREEATAAGRIPCLQKDYDNARALGEAMRAAAEAYLGAPMEELLREVVVVWQEGGFWRRAMIDVMTPDLLNLVDLKSTSASAAPDPSARRIYDAGYHVQRAHYESGIDALDPGNRGRRKFAFIFGETTPPCLVGGPMELSETGRTIGERQRQIGTTLWDSCLKHGSWPGYSQDPIIAEPPTWVVSNWELRMMNDPTLNPVQE